MNEPKYITIVRQLRSGIQQGLYESGKKLPSENELAEQTGYSRQTIRQAMSILESEGLTERIRGSGTYVKSARPRRARTNNIAVVTTYIGEYIFPAILQGISGALSEKGYTPLLSATQNRVDIEREVLKSLMQKPIDGIIVEGTKTALPNPNIELYEEIEKQGIPVVFINGYYADLKQPIYVVMNDREGGRLACEALLKEGHRHIAGFFKIDDIQGHRRYAGYAEALVKAGLGVEDDHVLWYTTESRDLLIHNSAAEVLRGCSAAVCYNDETALLAIQACKEEDVSWVSFDQSIYARMPEAPLRSLGNPKEVLGRLAAEKLICLLNGGKETSVVLPWSPMAYNQPEDTI